MSTDFIMRIHEAFYEDYDVYAPLKAVSKDFNDDGDTTDAIEINNSDDRDKSVINLLSDTALLINNGIYRTISIEKTDSGYIINVQNEAEMGAVLMTQEMINELLHNGSTIGSSNGSQLDISISRNNYKKFIDSPIHAPANRPSNTGRRTDESADGTYHLKY